MVQNRLTLGWCVALAGTAGFFAAALVPGVVGGPSSELLHHAFGSVCHQLPERSVHLGAGPIALCHRCTGMLAGLLLGIALPGLVRVPLAVFRSGSQGRLLLLALIPTAVDWALGASGLWANTPGSRVATGLLFGSVAGVILAANLLTPSGRSVSPTPLTHA